MIKAQDLSKHYTIGGQRIVAVDGVNLEVKQGEILSIIGHSGSGKSTLLSLLGGLSRPDSGTVTIDNTRLWDISDAQLSHFRNQNINFIYQFASLIPTLNSLENVMLPSAFGPVATDVKGKARELLELVGLKDEMERYPAELSGGQQRRVAIARAFINNPKVVLADEPTGDLDEETESNIFDLFKSLNKEHNITFVIVTHSRELAAMTDHQLQMTSGVIANQTA